MRRERNVSPVHSSSQHSRLSWGSHHSPSGLISPLTVSTRTFISVSVYKGSESEGLLRKHWLRHLTLSSHTIIKYALLKPHLSTPSLFLRLQLKSEYSGEFSVFTIKYIINTLSLSGYLLLLPVALILNRISLLFKLVCWWLIRMPLAHRLCLGKGFIIFLYYYV